MYVLRKVNTKILDKKEIKDANPEALITYSDCGQQSLRHISHNDANKEDDGLQPAVTQDDGQDEKRHTEEHGHTCDNVDEMLNLLGNGSFAGVQTRSQSSNSTHDCAISGVDDDTTSCAWFKKRNITLKCNAVRDFVIFFTDTFMKWNVFCF